jgi:uncharacterized protein (DUF1499 family)
VFHTKHSLLKNLVILPGLLVVLFGYVRDNLPGGEAVKESGKIIWVQDGKLIACGKRPNCVCSEDSNNDFLIPPISYSSQTLLAWKVLLEVLQDMGGRVEQGDDSFVHVTFRSTIFRFIDDVCCRLDKEDEIIHIRSASRVGYSDFGVNRKRVEELRKRFVKKMEKKRVDI